MKASLLYNRRWLAGFFDGEGSVHLEYTTNGSKTGNRTFRLRVQIAQNNRPLLEILKRKFGGYIKGKGCPQLSWVSKDSEKILKYLLPYLIVKKKVALLGLQHRNLIGRIRGKKGKGIELTPFSKKKNLWIRKEIMRLNQAN